MVAWRVLSTLGTVDGVCKMAHVYAVFKKYSHADMVPSEWTLWCVWYVQISRLLYSLSLLVVELSALPYLYPLASKLCDESANCTLKAPLY